MFKSRTITSTTKKQISDSHNRAGRAPMTDNHILGGSGDLVLDSGGGS